MPVRAGQGSRRGGALVRAFASARHEYRGAPGFQRLAGRTSQPPRRNPVAQGIWSATDLLPKERLQALCEPPAERPKRRPLLRYAVAAGLFAVALGLGLFSGLSSSTDYSGEYATAFGERRHIALPDGSVIDLNSRSRVRIEFAHRQRRVELAEGEALFTVEHDAGRPFTVETGNGQVTVTGTRFDVRRDADGTRIAVAQGSVKVRDAPRPRLGSSA